MPRKKSKRKTTKNRATRKAVREIPYEDVSIKDFADVKNAQDKVKKISRGLTSKTVYNFVEMKNEGLSWYEKEEFQSDQEFSGGEENIKEVWDTDKFKLRESPAGIIGQTIVKQKRKRSGRKLTHSTGTFSGQVTYPLDLWYMLSKYLYPEDVAKFALICRGTYEVLNSVKFWLRFYQHHVSNPHKLPDELKPDRIECQPGLRARVIRALYHGYDVLKNRILPRADLCRESPDNLMSYTCSSMWCRKTLYKKETKIWMFYFKFADRTGIQAKEIKRFSQKWFNTVDYVNDNPELHKTVLAISCMNYIPVVPVIGLVLTEVLIGVSQGMKHIRVKLTFHSHREDGRYRPETGIQVILDPALDVRVLHWWHPLYPYLMA